MRKKLNTYVLNYKGEPVKDRQGKAVIAEEADTIAALVYFRFKIGIRAFKDMLANECKIVRV